MTGWIKDDNVIQFRNAKAKPEDAIWMSDAAKHVEGAGRLLAAPLEGDRLPWSKTHHQFRFRPSEFTIWAGANSAGKSLMLGQVTLGLLQQTRHVGMVSLEMLPERTVARMLRQAACVREPSVEFGRKFRDWLTDKFFLYERSTSLTPKRTIEIIDYCVSEFGTQHVFIDSLMKCNVGADSFQAQKAFIEALTIAAKRTKAHIHLVAHFGKPKGKGPVDRYSIKGPTEISDIADNVMIMIRNYRKRTEAEKKEEDRSEKIMAQSDGRLLVDKQRNGEWDGAVNLWFERESQQYVTSEGSRAIDFLEWSYPDEAEKERAAIQVEPWTLDDK